MPWWNQRKGADWWWNEHGSGGGHEWRGGSSWNSSDWDWAGNNRRGRGSEGGGCGFGQKREKRAPALNAEAMKPEPGALSEGSNEGLKEPRQRPRRRKRPLLRG